MRDTRANRPPRGFTLVELAALIVAAGAAAGVFVAAQPPADGKSPPVKGDGGNVLATAKGRAIARQLKDSTQIRALNQGLIMWANNNQSTYPLPSKIDTADETVADKGRAKDITASIFSIMIFNGTISTEICISPAEASKNIRSDKNYSFSDPKKAVNPPNALWDPAFRADWTGKNPGNFSYAHLQPSKGRVKEWADTFNSWMPAIGNRGPEIDKVDVDDQAQRYTVTTKIKDSVTFKIHGPPDSWQGNIAFNDNHVGYITTISPTIPKDWGTTYTTKEGKVRSDTFFYDESDDKDGANAFLGIFTKAGDKAADFKSIWD